MKHGTNGILSLWSTLYAYPMYCRERALILIKTKCGLCLGSLTYCVTRYMPQINLALGLSLVYLTAVVESTSINYGG